MEEEEDSEDSGSGDSDNDEDPDQALNQKSVTELTIKKRPSIRANNATRNDRHAVRRSLFKKVSPVRALENETQRAHIKSRSSSQPAQALDFPIKPSSDLTKEPSIENNQSIKMTQEKEGRLVDPISTTSRNTHKLFKCVQFPINASEQTMDHGHYQKEYPLEELTRSVAPIGDNKTVPGGFNRFNSFRLNDRLSNKLVDRLANFTGDFFFQFQ